MSALARWKEAQSRPPHRPQSKHQKRCEARGHGAYHLSRHATIAAPGELPEQLPFMLVCNFCALVIACEVPEVECTPTK